MDGWAPLMARVQLASSMSILVIVPTGLLAGYAAAALYALAEY
jgi:hypothetical protein